MAEHGHGHESPSRHRGGHNEWIGRKTKEAIGVGGASAFFGAALLTAWGIVFPPAVAVAIGMVGATGYAYGARDQAGGKGHH